jgi:OOP family OmpA-OmpF porin
MKAKFFKFGLIGALLAITGCAEYHRRVLENTMPAGDTFTIALAKQYEILGEIEQNKMYDEASADWYYLKAIKARQGFYILPTSLGQWDIEEDKLPELCKARERLMQTFFFGARETFPTKTAYAQAHFDCWVEQQSEGWQMADIAWCRAEFLKSISDLEKKLGYHAYVPVPEAMVQ